MKKVNAGVLFIYLAFLAEVLSLSVCKHLLPSKINPVFTSFFSVFIIVQAYRIWKRKKETTQREIKGKRIIYLKAFSIALALLTFTGFVFFFASEPIDIRKSDIIPIIQQFYLDRLFNGEFVYAAVDRGTYFWTPNYFPMHWLPFSVSNLMGLDHRILALFLLLTVVLYYSFKTISPSADTTNTGVKLLLPYIVLFFMRADERVILGHTVETLICSYYMLFAVSILTRNMFVKAIGLSSILLSRFSIVLWTPFYVISTFLYNKKEATRLCLYCITIALLVFVIPFLSKDPAIVINGFNGFTEVYLLEWKGQSWQAPGDNPYQLFNGLGFACYYYTYWPGELADKLKALVITQLAMNILMAVASVVFMKKLSKTIGTERYQLLTLKATLIVFYSFIVVPYQYLFMVPLFVSVVIVSQFSLFEE